MLDRRGLERAVERSEILELFELRDVTKLVHRHRGRRGVARLRSVVADLDPLVLLAHSELEVRFIHPCRDAALPTPVVNGRLIAAGERLEVDFHWPEWRLIVETDGRAFHRTNRARGRDVHRDAILATAGWQVIRVGWVDVVTEPAPLVARLRRRFA